MKTDNRQNRVWMDLRLMLEEKPKEFEFVLPGLLPGTVGALVAPGATGKSFLALEIAFEVASGCKLIGLAQTCGRVVVYSGEDPELPLSHRIHAIGNHLSPEHKKKVVENLAIADAVGNSMNVTWYSEVGQIIEECAGAKLIIFDTLSRFHDKDENSNEDMSLVMGAFEHIAKATGAAVVFLHHVAKGVAKNNDYSQQASRGAGALIDNARWGAYMARMTENDLKDLYVQDDDPKWREIEPINVPLKSVGKDDMWKYVRFGVNKLNYGHFIEEMWLERAAGGVLLPARFYDVEGNLISSGQSPV